MAGDIPQGKHKIGLFTLIMIAVVSVDSLRNLPISAQYGFSLVTFYSLAGLMFFLPLTYITSQLATTYPQTGGSYVWIKNAFGQSTGALALWLQWVYNMIWYPTIFAFIASTLAALVCPDYTHNKWFILITSLLAFWSLSLLHTRGIKASGWFSTASAIIGTLLPMVMIIILALVWLSQGHPSATPIESSALLPSAHDLQNIGFFSNILFSVLGLEVIAMHAGNVIKPAQTYPKALIISALLILLTLSLSSMALCVIVPASEMSLVGGIMEVLERFFSVYNIPNIRLFIGACILIGGLGIASSWMISLARGLHVSLLPAPVPHCMIKLNKHEMPTGILMFQSIVFTALLLIFLLFPTLNTAYWILSALTAQYALFYYVILFAAAMKLLITKAQSKRERRLAAILPIVAMLVSIFGIIAGFMPPSLIESHEYTRYITIMLLGSLFPMVLIGLFLVKRRGVLHHQNEWLQEHKPSLKSRRVENE